jgi:RNA polymerase sigma factor (sigma-70 family)
MAMQGYSHLLDSQLIAEIQRGNRDAFNELQLRHDEVVYHYIYRRIGNHHDAEDLKQETFLRALANIDRYQDTNLRGWLYRIAGNLVIDYFRKRRQIPTEINETETEEEATAKAFLETELDTQPQPGEQVTRKEQFAFIDVVLNESLIENQPTEEKKRRGMLNKKAFYLFVIDKLPIKKIKAELKPAAKELGIELSDSFFENWKRDILKPFCDHIVEKYPFWIQELISQEIRKKSLTETEYTITYLLWDQGKSINEVADERKKSIEIVQSLLKQAKEKIKEELVKTLGGRIQRKKVKGNRTVCRF